MNLIVGGLILSLGIFWLVEGEPWDCALTNKKYANEGSSVVMEFRFSNFIVNQIVQVISFDGKFVLTVLYTTISTGTVVKLEPGYTCDGKLNDGLLYLTVQQVTKDNAGLYFAYRTGNGITDNTQCTAVYRLGIPTTPVIRQYTIPSVGQAVAMICNSSSTTTPSNHSLNMLYDWKVNDTDNPSGRYIYSTSKDTITLNYAAISDFGSRFKCSSHENVSGGITSSFSDEVVLKVNYGPLNSRFDPQENSYDIEEYTFLPSIICRADCYPECEFKWTKTETGEIVNNSASLQLGSLVSDKAGIYRCTVIRLGGSQSTMDLTVNVIFGPKNIGVIPNILKVRADENSVLSPRNCSAKCWQCDYSWTGPGGYIPSQILNLGSLNRSNHGEYTCTAVNKRTTKWPTQTTVLKVEVRYGPDTVDLSPAKMAYVVDEMTILNDVICLADCFPSCSYTWTKHGNGTAISNTGRLSLGIVYKEYAGRYTCKAVNTEISPQKSADNYLEITVRYPPEMNTRFSSSNRSAGSDLTLYCEGVGNPPIYNYTGLTQTLGIVEIPNTNMAKDGYDMYSSIHFKKLQLQDTGTYTCKMNNGVKDRNGRLDQTASATIVVEVAPEVLTNNLEFTGATDGVIQVEIPFYSHPDILSVKFVPANKTDITNNERFNVSYSPSAVKAVFYGKEVTLDGFKAYLVISNLMEQDFGNYTLVLQNSKGSSSIPLSIVAKSVPATPLDFHYVPGSRMPKFVWEEGFNGGYSQSFVIQTSISGRRQWINQTNILEKDERYYFNKSLYTAIIDGLLPGTYTARLIAKNSIGEAIPLELNSTFDVLSEATGQGAQMLTAAIAGGTSAAVIVLVAVVVVIFIKRRAKSTGKETSNLRPKKLERQKTEECSSDEDEIVENKLYESAGQIISGDEPVYNKPTKKVNVDTKNTDVYAVVDKTNKKDDQKVKKEKSKKKKQIAQGEIYENAPEKSTSGSNTYGNAAFQDDAYENPEGSKPSKTPKKNISPDGLIYADLAFNDQPKGQKKLLIHGLDDMTTYVQVDFNRKADPLPDSDTEEQSENKKK